jgi:hypothetical protein
MTPGESIRILTLEGDGRTLWDEWFDSQGVPT